MKINRRIILKSIVAVLVLVPLIISATACSSGAGGGRTGKYAALVDGEPITWDELYEALIRENGEAVLNILIAEKIINKEAAKNNIVISKQELEEELGALYEYYGGKESFIETIELYGYSLDEISRDVETNLKLKKLLEPDIIITEEEIADYYERNKSMFADEESEDEYATLEESREEIRDLIFNEKMSFVYDMWIGQKYSEYEITNYLTR